MTRFLRALHPGDDPETQRHRSSVLVAIVLELDKPENKEHKKVWYALEAAHKKALVLMLEHDFLKAIGGNSGATREERAYAIHQILPPNFRLADIKFFFAAYLPEKYRGIAVETEPKGPPKKTGPKPAKYGADDDEVDDNMKNVMSILDGVDCQEAEDSPNHNQAVNT
jgi:hypothetical protein